MAWHGIRTGPRLGRDLSRPGGRPSYRASNAAFLELGSWSCPGFLPRAAMRAGRSAHRAAPRPRHRPDVLTRCSNRILPKPDRQRLGDALLDAGASGRRWTTRRPVSLTTGSSPAAARVGIMVLTPREMPGFGFHDEDLAEPADRKARWPYAQISRGRCNWITAKNRSSSESS